MANLIGEGTYGSVYRPPLQCKQKRIDDKYGNDNYVMKVSTEDSIKPERNIAKILHKIDPTSKYFIYIIPIKKVNLNVNIYKIGSHVVKYNPNSDYYGYYMKYGGLTLKQYINENRNIITVDLIWSWLCKLIEALHILYDHNILHLDIKCANIVVDQNREIRLIDFGLSNILTENVKHNKNILVDQFYSIYPLFYNVLYSSYSELNLIYDCLFSKNTKKNLRKLIKKLTDEIDDVELYMDTILMPNIHKIDIYCLSYIFMFYIYMEMKMKFKSENEFLSYHLKCLSLKMLELDPDKQFNIKECLNYQNVVNYISNTKLKDNLKNIIWIYCKGDVKGY